MKKVTVYHPQNYHLNNGSMVFFGEQIEHSVLDDGSLLIKHWHTANEQGHARFASGQWAYVCESSPRADSHKPEVNRAWKEDSRAWK